MNTEPMTSRERRKARAMVRDIAKQVKFQDRYISADEWWIFVFAGAYGQELLPNPFHQEFPEAPMFVVQNKKRSRNLNVTNASELITALYAFGNERGVEWSDPKWVAEVRAWAEEAKRAA